jgi:hypothetical protein
MQPIPENLVKDALVVGGVKRKVTMQNQNQSNGKKRDRAHNNSLFLRCLI